MNDYNSIALEERNIRHRGEKDADTVDRNNDDVGLALLPDLKKTRSSSSLESSYKIPRVTTIHENATKKLRTMSQGARFLRLCAFIIIEFLWLGFVLFCHFHIIVTPSDQLQFTLPGGLAINRDTLIKSGLSTVSIVVQQVALIPISDIVVEIYSGEWSHILALQDGQLTRVTDRVSTLTSSFTDKLTHCFDSRSSTRYRFAFAAALLSILLQAVAPGALTVSSDIRKVGTTITIGGLDPDQTDNTMPFVGGANDPPTLRARNLAMESARYEYVTWIQNSSVDYKINSNTLLFGMPPRDLLSTNSHIEYESDGVQFQYDCQWLAPSYINETMLASTWAFGGDTEAIIDYNAIPITDQTEAVTDTLPQVAYGMWPLMINYGPGQNNGSFAWLFIGDGSGPDSNNTLTPINLDTIPSSARTTNSTGWCDLVNTTTCDPDRSTDASVLLCDPHMQVVSAHVTLQGTQLNASVVGNTLVIGNIDHDEASRMLARSLDGMPFDNVLFQVNNRILTYGLSQLAVNFALQQNDLPTEQPLPLVPKSLDNLGNLVQSYTTIAGASAYLDGSLLGNRTVAAQTFEPIQRLVCSWPQWGASVALFAVIAILVACIILIQRLEKGNLVPLTLASVLVAVESERQERLAESPQEDGFDSKSYT